MQKIFPSPRIGIFGKKRENETSPSTSPEHISGFQNMLFVFRKSFYAKDLKIRPEGFGPPTLGSEDRCAIGFWNYFFAEVRLLTFFVFFPPVFFGEVFLVIDFFVVFFFVDFFVGDAVFLAAFPVVFFDDFFAFFSVCFFGDFFSAFWDDFFAVFLAAFLLDFLVAFFLGADLFSSEVANSTPKIPSRLSESSVSESALPDGMATDVSISSR